MDLGDAAVAAGGGAAVVVPGADGAALRGGPGAGFAADVEELGHTTDDHAVHAGVAREPPDGFAGDYRAVLGCDERPRVVDHVFVLNRDAYGGGLGVDLVFID